MVALDSRWLLITLGALLVAVLAALMVMFERSSAHLNELAERISHIQDRQRLLAQISGSVFEAEATQRAQILNYGAAVFSTLGEVRERIASHLTALQQSYASDGLDSRDVQEMSRLVDQRMGEIAHALTLLRVEGRAAAEKYVLAGPARQTAAQLRQALRQREASEADAFVEAWAQYLVDLRATRRAMTGVSLLNLLLLSILAYLLTRALQRRERQAEVLSRLVDERTAELAALSSHLQEVSEREKQQLARELHDALGGLLIATKMDLAWLRSRLPTDDPELLLRWRRVQQSLDHGVDLKRRVVEQLRPTLLDNMGLYAALRWQVQETCGRAGLRCMADLPESEISLTNEASIALFRIAQESLTNILKHSGATEARLSVTVDETHFRMSITDNGQGFSSTPTGAAGGQGLVGMRHRIHGLGGTIELRNREEGGAEVRVAVPLERIVQTAQNEASSAGTEALGRG